VGADLGDAVDRAQSVGQMLTHRTDVLQDLLVLDRRERGQTDRGGQRETGVGRTGQWFASSAELSGADAPDAMTLAKGLGGGFPPNGRSAGSARPRSS
jgi:hypothetical protein